MAAKPIGCITTLDDAVEYASAAIAAAGTACPNAKNAYELALGLIMNLYYTVPPGSAQEAAAVKTAVNELFLANRACGASVGKTPQASIPPCSSSGSGSGSGGKPDILGPDPVGPDPTNPATSGSGAGLWLVGGAILAGLLLLGKKDDKQKPRR